MPFSDDCTIGRPLRGPPGALGPGDEIPIVVRSKRGIHDAENGMPPRNRNIDDDNELVAGTTHYPPVFNDGARFSCGDGHGAQGGGEVCVTTIETALTRTFRLTLRDDLDFNYPRAETPTHFITMVMDRPRPVRGDGAARHAGPARAPAPVAEMSTRSAASRGICGSRRP